MDILAFVCSAIVFIASTWAVFAHHINDGVMGKIGLIGLAFGSLTAAVHVWDNGELSRHAVNMVIFSVIYLSVFVSLKMYIHYRNQHRVCDNETQGNT